MGKNKPEKLSGIEEWRRKKKEKNRQNNQKYEKNCEKRAASAREKCQLKKALFSELANTRWSQQTA